MTRTGRPSNHTLRIERAGRTSTAEIWLSERI